MSNDPCTPDAYFDSLYARTDDPWHYRDHWFEARKRAVLAAMLDRPRYRSAFEPGCANGEFTAVLAPRCERLLAADRHSRAVAAAARRNAGQAHVTVQAMKVPAQWPPGRFDLIVISEFAYYLSADQVRQLGQRIRESMEPDGMLLACHWLHPFDERACETREVHRLLAKTTGFHVIAEYREADYLAQAWTVDGKSPTQRS